MKRPHNWMPPARNVHFSAKRLRRLAKKIFAWYMEQVEGGKMERKDVPKDAAIYEEARKLL